MLKFLRKYQRDIGEVVPAAQYTKALTTFTESAAAFASCAGASYSRGIYRLYNISEIEQWTARVEEVFPEFKGRVICFGRDWLCNQFCLDKARRKGGEALVLLFEVGTGEVLEIPATLHSFHEEVLVGDAEAALSEGLFCDWREMDGGSLSPNQCVGYKVPLFLGGKDSVDNLERSDVDVYWEITGQLLISV